MDGRDPSPVSIGNYETPYIMGLITYDGLNHRPSGAGFRNHQVQVNRLNIGSHTINLLGTIVGKPIYYIGLCVYILGPYVIDWLNTLVNRLNLLGTMTSNP